MSASNDRFSVDLTGQVLDGTFGRFEVHEKLDEGGMGTVYLATQTSLGRKVIVKVPHVRYLGEPGFRERFAREIKRLIGLEHPNIVSIVTQGEHDAVPFFVLQYLAGGSLADRLRENRDLPGRLEDVMSWAPEVAKALDFVHGSGVVHRDVKPANILFDAAGNVFLSDFGIAKVTGDDLTDVSLTGSGAIGSPAYMAPEQGMGGQVTPAADLYALGATVYEALGGRPPFQGGTPMQVLFRKVNEPPPELLERLPSLDPDVSAAVMTALQKDPAKRQSGCVAFMESMRGAPEAKPARRAVTSRGTRTMPPGSAPTTSGRSGPGKRRAPQQRNVPERRQGAPRRRGRRLRLGFLVLLAGLGAGLHFGGMEAIRSLLDPSTSPKDAERSIAGAEGPDTPDSGTAMVPPPAEATDSDKDAAGAAREAYGTAYRVARHVWLYARVVPNAPTALPDAPLAKATFAREDWPAATRAYNDIRARLQARTATLRGSIHDAVKASRASQELATTDLSTSLERWRGIVTAATSDLAERQAALERTELAAARAAIAGELDALKIRVAYHAALVSEGSAALQDIEQSDASLAALRLLEAPADTWPEDAEETLGAWDGRTTALATAETWKQARSALGADFLRQEDGQTAVHAAAEGGEVIAVLRLLALGVPGDLADATGRLPLHLAAMAGNTKIFQALLTRTGGAFAEDAAGNRPFHYAAGGDSADILRLYEGESRLLTLRNRAGKTASALAVEQGSLKALDALVALGWVPKEIPSEGTPPLHLAVLHKRPEVVKWLLGHNAPAGYAIPRFDPPDPEGVPDYHQATLFIHCEACHLAAYLDRVDCLRLLGKPGTTSALAEYDLEGLPWGSVLCRTSTLANIAARGGALKCLAMALETWPESARDRRGITPLLTAFHWSQEVAVRWLLEHGSTLDEQDDQGKTCLLYAVSADIASLDLAASLGIDLTTNAVPGLSGLHALAGNAHILGERRRLILERLLAAGIAVDARANSGMTPLMVSVQWGSAEMISSLLKRGADPSTRPDSGRTLWHAWASRDIHSDEVAVLAALDACGVDATIEGKDGWSPIHVASVGGRVEAAKALVARGASLDSLSTSGRRPVHVAARNGRWEFLEYLESNEIPLAVRSTGGETAMHLACEGVNDRSALQATLRVLLKAGLDITSPTASGRLPIGSAALAGNSVAITVLHELGADVDTPEYSFTPLFMVIHNSHPEAIATLLALGANRNHVTSGKQTPLIYALKHVKDAAELANIITLLRGPSLKIDAANAAGLTALHVAVRLGDTTIVEMLLDMGASVKTEFDTGSEGAGIGELAHSYNEKGTALHLAAALGTKRMCELLLEHRAPVDGLHADDSTPLHIACGRTHAEIVRLLLKHRANPNHMGGGAPPIIRTTWDRAEPRNAIECVRALLAAGAKINRQAEMRLPALIDGEQDSVVRGTALHHLTSLAVGKDVPVSRRRDYYRFLEFLLERGASPNSFDDEGKTVLGSIASSSFAFDQSPEAVRRFSALLRKHGGR